MLDLRMPALGAGHGGLRLSDWTGRGMLWAWLGFLLLLLLILPGCSSRLAPVGDLWNYAPPPPGYYRVRSGDTLSRIARRSGRSLSELARWNRLGPPYTIYAGGLVRVTPPPGSSRSTLVASRSSTGTDRPSSRQTPSPQASTAGLRQTNQRSAPTSSQTQRADSTGIQTNSKSTASPDRGPVPWRWPLRGPVEKDFVAGDRTRSGIRITAPVGSAVRSAAPGVVVYSGDGLKGYGNLIIIKHNDRYLSAYGFNRKLLVAEGQKVDSGQKVAEVGVGASGQGRLHFEIRRDGQAVNPLQYLPKQG